jgi:predicted deacetylase
MQLVEEHTVLLSLHEVSPAYEDSVVASYDRLKALGIDSYTLLVTPLLEWKRNLSFEKHPMFVDYLLSLDLEISLHGYSYTTKSGRPEEFKNLDKKQTASRLRRGLKSILSNFGVKPSGFVPPGWVAPKRLKTALANLGFSYYAVGNQIYDLSSSISYSTVDTLISEKSKEPSLEASIVETELGGPLQIALHPLDYKRNRMYNLMEELVDCLDYKFLGYCDFLKNVESNS